MYRYCTLAIVAVAAAGCGGALRSGAPVVSPSLASSSIERLTIRRGDQRVEVDSPLVAGRRVERLAQQAGGYVEQASGSTDGSVTVVARVPAGSLDAVMDSVARFGKERRRQLTGTDVTDQYTDLEARLRSSIALRERLQQLLGRAESLDDVLKLEQQIGRLQAEIDSLQARLDQLRSGTALATLSVNFEEKRVLGPLGIAGKGLARGVSWLFVIK
ncbi:MAG: DUF4349 domain-containing protein [Gemmatimonadota bacterium]